MARYNGDVRHSDPRRILVMMLGDIGDLLLATPALRLLRDRYPAACIVAMTKPTTVRVLEGTGLVDGFLPVDKHLFDRPAATLRPAVLLRLLRSVSEMRRQRFDAVVLLHHLVTWWGTLKFAGLSLASGARLRAGLDNGRGVFLTHRAVDRGFDAAHESTYWLRVVAAMPGGRPARQPLAEPDRPIFNLTDEAQDRADALLRSRGLTPGDRMLAIHPGSGAYSVARRWFPDRFAVVADTLAERHGLRVVLLGNADERELADQVAGQMRRPAANLAGCTALDELAGVLRRCALLVGNDSGVAHMAAAVGTPVAAIFGPFNHNTWHPLGNSLVVRVSPALPCMPCVNRGFKRGYPEGFPPRYCLQEVTPEMVVAAAEALLDTAPKAVATSGRRT